jgi:hypothetical protein
MAGNTSPPLEQVLARDEREFIDALSGLWKYCRSHANFLPRQYIIDEEEMIFGGEAFFSHGYRYQLFVRAEEWHAD